MQLKILRQLVELQLCHNVDIKGTIDRAWGITHNKHKKKDPANARPDADDPNSRERLQVLPLGQDHQRKRFWAADGVHRSPCCVLPWPIFACICSATFLHSLECSADTVRSIILLLRVLMTPSSQIHRGSMCPQIHGRRLPLSNPSQLPGRNIWR